MCVYHDKHMFAVTNVFFATKHIFCHDKSMLAVTKHCRDKIKFVTKFSLS